MEMQSFSLKPMALTALVLKLTGKFKGKMEKQRCTLCSMNHIPMEYGLNFQTEGSIFMDSVFYIISVAAPYT